MKWRPLLPPPLCWPCQHVPKLCAHARGCSGGDAIRVGTSLDGPLGGQPRRSGYLRKRGCGGLSLERTATPTNGFAIHNALSGQYAAFAQDAIDNQQLVAKGKLKMTAHLATEVGFAAADVRAAKIKDSSRSRQ